MRRVVDTSRVRLARARRPRLLGAMTALAWLAALAGAGPALAGLQQEFAVFSDCPVSTPGVVECVVSQVTGGQFALGNRTVPINKTVTLQGGISSASQQLVPAADGQTLSRTSLTVPGGLVGIEGLGGEVTATAELAGAVELSQTNLLAGKGTAVALPLEVKLDNPLLGSGCYIGSASQPVSAQLTSGTTSPPAPNKPISGAPGHLAILHGGRLVLISGSSLVDNAFAVPGVNGCGLFGLLDGLVDLSAGVPAAAGHNTAILNGSLELASPATVVAQAALPELGRCVKAESSEEGKERVYHGGYDDSGCTVEDAFHHGKFEWLPGAAKHKFTGSGGKSTLETVSGQAVTCKHSTAKGEFTGTKAATAVVTFSQCERASTRESCQSSGASAGEIVTGSLAGGLGFIKDEEPKESELLVSVGMDLGREPSVLTAECGTSREAVVVKGSVIAPITKIDKKSSAFMLAYAATMGKQLPEAFEGASHDTLSAVLGTATAEQAGLTTKEKIANEEPLEIKAEQ